jgi:hypothetical protein
MVSMEPHDVVFFATPEELRDWFDANHTIADELWLGYYKKASRRPSVDWSQVVDEALCVGWIDGVRKRVDENTYQIRFSPRKATSTWSAINIERVAVLTSHGRMQPPAWTPSVAARKRSHARTPTSKPPPRCKPPMRPGFGRTRQRGPSSRHSRPAIVRSLSGESSVRSRRPPAGSGSRNLLRPRKMEPACEA